MIPNDDKNSQIEVGFFIVKVYARESEKSSLRQRNSPAGGVRT